MAAISKAEYLKRYLSKDQVKKDEKKKKRRKIKPSRDSKLKIIDDDIELKATKQGGIDDEFDDEAPTVAEIIDERPQHVQQLEAYRKNSRWKMLGAEEEVDDLAVQQYGVISQHSDKQITSDVSRAKQQRKRHDSSSSDCSPPRLKSASVSHLAKSQRHDSDSDNLSPQRKHNVEKKQKIRHDSDSDESPPRSSQMRLGSSQRTSAVMANDRKDFTDQLSPRHHKRDFDSDQSPQRKRKGGSISDQSPPRKRRGGSDSDQSPPRKRTGSSDSDQSPPRKRRGGSDSDQSPPRKQRGDSVSNLSPPRKKSQLDASHIVSKRSRPSRFDHNSDDTKKATKTLGGAKAGLSSAKEMREEAKKLREKEDRSFQSIDEETSGKNAKTVVRDKETGKRRDMKAEEAMNEEEEKKKNEQLKKYQQWGKGLKQLAVREARLEDAVHEASKPLARYKDDKDLDDMLRKEERAEDPMLAFIRTTKQKEEEKSGKVKKKELPRYKGPPPPPNRYNILPGYRWDGVDRSNGFEKKIFAQQANKKAVQEIAYKWSTEDM